MPFVDLAAQYASIAGELEQASLQALRATDYILGHEVERFEQEFAAFCGARYGIGVDSGTSALELALRACDVGPGDEVITAANTFIATVIAISSTGATPVLVDIDPRTFTMDVDRVQTAITPRTAAVVPVHLYGHPVDMDAILELAGRHGLKVIEDACQAHGARYRGRLVGSLGHAAAFSFYPSKNLGACGDAGMVVSDDERLADAVRMLRNYGQRTKYEHVSTGFNRRLDNVQAAILRVKLQHLASWNAARRAHAAAYTRLLAGSGVTTPTEADYAFAVWHLYVVRCADRVRVKFGLDQRGIASGIHYPIPVHLQPGCRSLGYARGDFPVTERVADEILSLPMYPELTPELIQDVSAAVLELVE